ncbi:c2H2-type domain-containing protein [Caerostris darwini]|uniref:C2H2-type domain-containing protein n=1 Tax=Caerostris darwini TaxID=1538125 RepID=A0AAV4REN4_9ARAC|nr:c2H2-type domain-containing protein [Caerostris darwini]
MEKLNDKCLPNKEMFHNILRNSSISDSDYNHALTVFEAFECKTFSNYLEIYENVDVVMLAEIFLSFRRTSMQSYHLDPVHFITSAQLTWNAGLKISKVELQLLGNVNEYLWFEKSMRGGVCLLGRRHAIANNPYIAENYDETLPSNYILALDANNFYGFAMSQFLPVGNFSWLDSEELSKFDVLELEEDSDIGYILEVDLLYPEHLHNMHNDLPLAPEHVLITYDISNYSKNLCDEFSLKSTLPSKKLTPNFFPKTNYVTHCLNLKFYLEQGMILTKIHRILAFKQSPWLKSYIDFNNKKRIEANSEFQKSFFKKMNNSFFGRTMINVRRKISIKGSLTAEGCKKNVSSPLLDYFEPINDNLTLFKMKKPNLVLDKPIFIGFCVLELSKLQMFKLYYTHFKSYYGSKCELLYSDTDSLYMNIETKDVYQDLRRKFKGILDLSNFERDSPMFDDSNKGKLGLLKSETL